MYWQGCFAVCWDRRFLPGRTLSGNPRILFTGNMRKNVLMSAGCIPQTGRTIRLFPIKAPNCPRRWIPGKTESGCRFSLHMRTATAICGGYTMITGVPQAGFPWSTWNWFMTALLSGKSMKHRS